MFNQLLRKIRPPGFELRQHQQPHDMSSQQASESRKRKRTQGNFIQLKLEASDHVHGNYSFM